MLEMYLNRETVLFPTARILIMSGQQSLPVYLFLYYYYAKQLCAYLYIIHYFLFTFKNELYLKRNYIMMSMYYIYYYYCNI